MLRRTQSKDDCLAETSVQEHQSPDLVCDASSRDRTSGSGLRRQVKAGISRRSDFPLRRECAALLVIDIQRYLSYADHEYFHQTAFPRMIGNTNKLMRQFRKIRDGDHPATVVWQPTGHGGGGEVIFTYLQATTTDGRDISLDYKLSGPLLAKIPRFGTPFDELFCDDCRPDPVTGKGDILLPKTSCSVFQSTNLDYLLRNLSIEQLVIAGQLTDQCVESAVRDAADLGYFVTVVDDACAAYSESSHQKGLQSMNGFCRILKTNDVIKELVREGEGGMDQNESAVSRNISSDDTVAKQQVCTFLKARGFHDAAESFASSFNEA